MTHLTLFARSGAPEQSHTPGRIVEGSPVTRFRVHAVAEDGRLSAGVWQATPGIWRVEYTEWEFCHILTGRGRLIEDGMAAVDMVPGAAFTIAPGFAGTWEVAETMTKHFVILDPPAET